MYGFSSLRSWSISTSASLKEISVFPFMAALHAIVDSFAIKAVIVEFLLFSLNSPMMLKMKMGTRQFESQLSLRSFAFSLQKKSCIV